MSDYVVVERYGVRFLEVRGKSYQVVLVHGANYLVPTEFIAAAQHVDQPALGSAPSESDDWITIPVVDGDGASKSVTLSKSRISKLPDLVEHTASPHVEIGVIDPRNGERKYFSVLDIRGKSLLLPLNSLTSGFVESYRAAWEGLVKSYEDLIRQGAPASAAASLLPPGQLHALLEIHDDESMIALLKAMGV